VLPHAGTVDERMDGTGSGNGLHLWSTPEAVLAGNHVRHFQDAVYLSFCDRTQALGNQLEDNGRYGFHTMYCQGTAIADNRFRYNVAGCAIMFSNHLQVHDNHFDHNRGPRTYGLLLRDCSDGEFERNSLVDNTIALFMDGSNRNRIAGNLVQDDGWGVLLYSSCAGNVFTGNAFVNDDYPVALDMKYTDNHFDDGRRGNYWSENASYDLDADGVSDVPYSPVTTFAFVSKQYPDLTVLARSPAVAALGVAERVFPSLRPSEAVDRFPLVAPPQRRAGAVGARTPPAHGGPLAIAGFGGLLGLSVLGLLRRPRA
jgi:nitrous oxidase accessory protein